MQCMLWGVRVGKSGGPGYECLGGCAAQDVGAAVLGGQGGRDTCRYLSEHRPWSGQCLMSVLCMPVREAEALKW